MRAFLLPLVSIAALSACSSATSSMPPGSISDVVVPTEGYETYVTSHNGYTRVRRSDTVAGDAAILAQFEDANPASPAGFRSLVDLGGTAVGDRVQTEIIVEEDEFQTLQRVLRLTADVEAYTPENIAQAGGEIVLSGADYSVVRVGPATGPEGQLSDNGSLYLALNFDTETAAIRILNRTLYYHTSQSAPMDLRRVDLLGENLPFNIETGAFGGEISGEVFQLAVRLGGYSIPVTGTLLGQVGGSSPTDLVAGGVFEASGSGPGLFGSTTETATVEGVFWASN